MNEQYPLVPDNGSGTPPPAQDQPYVYPSPITYFVESVPLAALNQIVDFAHRERETAVANERLRNQLQRKYVKEEAYTAAIEVSGNCICTQNKYGTWVPILNCTVRWAVHLIPQPPLKGKPYYAIQLSVSAQTVSITEDDFYTDSMLLSKLQEVPGVKITIRKTRKSTMDLIRQAIQCEIRVLPVSVYAGWLKQKDGNFKFTVFDDFSSHRKSGKLFPHELPDTSPAVADLAIKNWNPAFSLITDPFMRWFLTLWFHMSIITSLLDKLGCQIPLGLHIFSENHVCHAYLRRLFCWYGDPVLSMDMPSDDFINQVLARKDQPLVIEDTDRTKHAAANTATVGGLLSLHSLPWKNGRDSKPMPIQALPTILSNIVSELICDPNLVTLELSPDQFLSGHFSQDFPTAENLQEYLAAFVNYTSKNIAELRSLLEAASKEAWTLADGALTESCVNTLKIMFGLHRFLEGFYGAAAPGTDVQLDELIPRLLEVLQEASEKMELSTNLASHFVTLARNMIQHGQLHVYPLEKREQVFCAIYADEESLYFTFDAMKAVCQQLDHSRPVVLQSLAKAGLVQGCSINRSTVMSRVQLYTVYGQRKGVPVYRLQRDAFEVIGDPLIIEEGGVEA